MKKLLIGCGVLSLLLLGALGYIGWKLGPSAMQLMDTFESVGQSFVLLNERYPYDPETERDFQADRFQTALETRSALRIELGDTVQRFRDIEEGKLGILDGILEGFTAVAKPFEASTRLFDEARMSPVEFTQHVRTYWAAAKSAHDGLGDQQALASLRANYTLFADTYAQAREDSEDLPRLSELLEGVHPEQVAGAREFLAMNHDLAGLDQAELLMELLMVQFSDPQAGFAHLQTSNENFSGSITIKTGDGAADDR